MRIIISILIIVGCSLAALGVHILLDRHQCRRRNGTSCPGRCHGCPMKNRKINN